MDISDDTCCCYQCGAINIGFTLEECETCPECGAYDIAAYEDVCHEVDNTDQGD